MLDTAEGWGDPTVLGRESLLVLPSPPGDQLEQEARLVLGVLAVPHCVKVLLSDGLGCRMLRSTLMWYEAPASRGPWHGLCPNPLTPSTLTP